MSLPKNMVEVKRGDELQLLALRDFHLADVAARSRSARDPGHPWLLLDAKFLNFWAHTRIVADTGTVIAGYGGMIKQEAVAQIYR